MSKQLPQPQKGKGWKRGLGWHKGAHTARQWLEAVAPLTQPQTCVPASVYTSSTPDTRRKAGNRQRGEAL